MKKTYLVALYVSLLAGLEFPDFDLHLLVFLGHRSILTHGIIVPFFLYKFLTKEGYSKISNKIFGRFFSNKDFSREILDYAYIGFLIGKFLGPIFRSKSSIKKNLKKANININTNKIASNVLGNYGRIFAEYVHLKNFRNEKLNKYLSIEGSEYLNEIKKK